MGDIFVVGIWLKFVVLLLVPSATTWFACSSLVSVKHLRAMHILSTYSFPIHSYIFIRDSLYMQYTRVNLKVKMNSKLRDKYMRIGWRAALHYSVDCQGTKRSSEIRRGMDTPLSDCPPEKNNASQFASFGQRRGNKNLRKYIAGCDGAIWNTQHVSMKHVFGWIELLKAGRTSVLD